MKKISLHHVSATVRHPQEALDFYSGFLGLKLVKQTLNYDDEKTIHLYFGNPEIKGHTLLTLFTIPQAQEGVLGGGQVNEIMFSIPKGSLEFWKQRFAQFKYKYTESTMFNKTTLQFKDRHEIGLSLIESEDDLLSAHEFNGITKNEAIIDIVAVKVAATTYEETKNFLTSVANLTLNQSNMFYDEYTFNDGLNKKIYLVRNNIPRGIDGAGTVHHLALGVETLDDLKDLLKLEEMARATEIKDRNYFKAIYVREKGGNIIEFSTNNAHLTIDEELNDLGKTFIIPKHYMNNKDEILKTIIPLHINEITEITDYPYLDKLSHDMFYDHKKRLARINELARKEFLTEEEQEERKRLREEYVRTIREGFRSSLDSIEVEDEKNESH